MREECWGFSCGVKQLLPEMRNREKSQGLLFLSPDLPDRRQHRKAMRRSLQRTQPSVGSEGPGGAGRENAQHGGEAKPLSDMTSSDLCSFWLFRHFSVSQCTVDMEGSVAEWVLFF